MEVDSWITVTILVNFIALVFQIGAYTAPMWYWSQTNSLYQGIGLWYWVGSLTNAAVSAGYYDTAPFVALRVLQSVGTAGVLTLVVFLIVYKIGYDGRWSSMSNLNTVNIAATILCVITILILLASAAVFAAYYWPNFQIVNSATAEKTSLPWSPMMSFLAALILIVVCVFIRVNCRPEIYKGNVIPMSGDAKFELHPHVQNGNANRYYNQTPYTDDRYAAAEDHRSSVQSRVRGYDDYDDTRRNGALANYEPRSTYINRVFTTEPEHAVYYNKPTSREFRENRDREIGHTIYTGSGFSYLKGEVNRLDRDEVRYSRQVTDYSSPRLQQGDDYYDHLRSSGRGRDLSSSNRTYNQSSNVYIYRPHQY